MKTFTCSDVEDIDVYAGGIAEIPQDGASVGALFSCIIGQQFKDLKDGDRYWYENRGVEGFSPGIPNLPKLVDIATLKNNFNKLKKFGLMHLMGLIFVFNSVYFAAQLQEIRKVKLAKIMCENLDVDPIQYDVFHVPSPR